MGLQESTQAPRCSDSVEECQSRWYPCQRTWTLRMIILKFFGFTEVFPKYPILTQEETNTEHWAPTWCNWNQQAVKCLLRVCNCGHVSCHQVAATPAQPRKLKLLLKKKSPQFRASEGQIEACSFEKTKTTQQSRVMVEEGGALHVISHARNDADNRLPLPTLDSTRCRQSVTGPNTVIKQNLNKFPKQ